MESKSFRRINASCTELKGKADLILKRQDENRKVLDWIKDPDDPEPSHDSIRLQTGLDDADTQAGKWFLRTPAFEDWLNGIGSDPAGVFWVKGFSKGSPGILHSGH